MAKAPMRMRLTAALRTMTREAGRGATTGIGVDGWRTDKCNFSEDWTGVRGGSSGREFGAELGREQMAEAAEKSGGEKAETNSVAMKRVLIVRLGAIGDVLMLLPSAYELHRRGARVDWVCGKVVAPLLAMYPWVNRIEVDDTELYHGGRAGQMRQLAKLWRRLAGRKYDLCAVVQYDKRYRWLAGAVRAEKRIELSHEERGRELLAGRWHANEYARVLGLVGDGFREENVRLLRPEVVPAVAIGELASGGRGRVGMVPAGAKNVLRESALRRWPVENYVALTRELVRRGYEVVLTGSAEDGWVRKDFAELLAGSGGGSQVQDWIGRTTLPELVGLYDACDVVVTHDTGCMHVAGISTAKVLAIFGPTEPGSFLPRREGVKALWGGERLACRPCYDGRDFAPCQWNGCVREISVERVVGEMEALLAE
jgi:heptosyltransferase-2